MTDDGVGLAERSDRLVRPDWLDRTGWTGLAGPDWRDRAEAGQPDRAGRVQKLPELRWWWVAAAAAATAAVIALATWLLVSQVATALTSDAARAELDAIRTALSLAVGTGGAFALWGALDLDLSRAVLIDFRLEGRSRREARDFSAEPGSLPRNFAGYAISATGSSINSSSSTSSRSSAIRCRGTVFPVPASTSEVPGPGSWRRSRRCPTGGAFPLTGH